MPRLLFLATMAAVLLASPLRAVETVRVDASSGAPRLLVDGKSVRARIFFGNPGALPIEVGPEGAHASFEFTCLDDAPGNGTMHLRFGESPGEVDLDDVAVTDLDAGTPLFASAFEGGAAEFARDWAFWPTGTANTVGTAGVAPGAGRDGSGALQVTLRAPADGKWPGYHVFRRPSLTLVKGHRYRVSFWARAVPARRLQVAFYRPGTPYVYLGGPDVFGAQIKMAASAGVDLVSFSIRPDWPKPGAAPDWSGADRICRRVLDANPNALLVPRIHLPAPPWWTDAHPDDLMAWDEPSDAGKIASVASPAYRHDAAAVLGGLVAHLEERFGPHIAGYHPAGQNTDEWFYEGSWDHPLNGYGAADLRAWRQWLQRRYPTDDALRAAWRDPSATLAGAAVPAPEARRASPGGTLRDPAREQAVIDFADFQQEAMADCVGELAHAARQASGGRKLVLFFYGYLFELSPMGNGPGTSGHYALRRVLDSPDIDVLCSPISYFDRGLGGGAPNMTAAQSIALAGKMYLREDDTFTYLAAGTPPGADAAVRIEEETWQELERNVARAALENEATWWMDLGAVGWFLDQRLWDGMARLGALDQALLDHPMPFRPEVAAVVDEAALRRVTPEGSRVAGTGVGRIRGALGRMGAPFGQYLQDDVAAGKVRAKLYVFSSAWRLSSAGRRALLDATRGGVRLWCYAPGAQDGDAASPAAMRELTGFRFHALSGVAAWAEPTALGKEKGLVAFGLKGPAPAPLFAADPTGGEVLATYPDGSAAVVSRKGDDGVSIFVGAPGLTPELLREAARLAGVHLYAAADCNVYANGPFLALHGAQDGPLKIDTGRADPVSDLLTGEELGHGPFLSLALKKGETRILRIGPLP